MARGTMVVYVGRENAPAAPLAPQQVSQPASAGTATSASRRAYCRRTLRIAGVSSAAKVAAATRPPGDSGLRPAQVWHQAASQQPAARGAGSDRRTDPRKRPPEAGAGISSASLTAAVAVTDEPLQLSPGNVFSGTGSCSGLSWLIEQAKARAW